jgi:hypothetical protein
LPSSRFFRVFQLFKYSIYSLLMLNVFIFFHDDWTASSHLFIDGVSLGQLFQAFSPTIDTASWVVLLLLFEMETYVLSDEQVQKYKWRLHGVRFLSYIFILLSFNGYWDKAYELYQVQPVRATTACELVDNQTVYLLALDEFESLTADNCSQLPEQGGFVRLDNTNIVADTQALKAARHLAWVDVINAAAWLVIVVMLEMDVWLQLRDGIPKAVFVASSAVKISCYSTLLGAAIFWGWAGAFIDFWDAFLWLVAFVFIEMNIVTWREETEAEHEADESAMA